MPKVCATLRRGRSFECSKRGFVVLLDERRADVMPVVDLPHGQCPPGELLNKRIPKFVERSGEGEQNPLAALKRLE